MKTMLFKNGKERAVAMVKILVILCSLVALHCQAAMAQDGNAGINQATSEVKSYFDTGTKLMYAIGAINGLVGAIKVYKKMGDGDHDTSKVASSWFASMIFLVIVATVIKAFLGV